MIKRLISEKQKEILRDKLSLEKLVQLLIKKGILKKEELEELK